MIFLCYFCDKPKENIMKKILFILFAAQFVLAPYMTKSYGARAVEENHEY